MPRSNLIKKVAWLLSLMLVGFISFLLTTHSQKTVFQDSYLDLAVAPASATTELDGRRVIAKITKVTSGEHTIIVSKPGFSSQTKKVNVAATQTIFVGAVLAPNARDTTNWYATHPNDRQLGESVTGRGSIDAAQQAIANNPLLNQLPYIEYSGLFRVDYGVPAANADQPALYVQAFDAPARQAALAWVRSSGISPASVDIIFKDFSSPLQPAGGD